MRAVFSYRTPYTVSAPPVLPSGSLLGRRQRWRRAQVPLATVLLMLMLPTLIVHLLCPAGMAQVADRTTVLSEACTLGEGVYRRVGELEAASDSDDLTTRLAGALTKKQNVAAHRKGCKD